MSPSQRQAIDVNDAEGVIGELLSIAFLIRETTEDRGPLSEEGKDAVHFLACLTHERAKYLDKLMQDATRG